MEITFTPDRGDAVWLDFTPQVGREQAGRRPALILSPRVYNERVGLTIVCPITSRVKGYPFEVQIPANLELHGVVLADQVRSLDWRGRRAELIRRLPNEVVDEVLQKLGTLIGK